VILTAEGGRLRLAGVAGYSGSLEEGTSFHVSGDTESVRVEVRSGASLLSHDRDHVRVLAGDTVFLPPFVETEGEERIRLRSREGVLLLPPEAGKQLEGRDNPHLEEMEEQWKPRRESPRIP
jgi:hypothetical protein